MTEQLPLDFSKPTQRAAQVTAAREIGVLPLTVTVLTALQVTGIGKTKLYELIAKGELQTVKVGRRTLVQMASLRRLVASDAPSSP